MAIKKISVSDIPKADLGDIMVCVMKELLVSIVLLDDADDLVLRARLTC